MATDKPDNPTEATPLMLPSHDRSFYHNSPRALLSQEAFANAPLSPAPATDSLPYNHYNTIDWLQELVTDNKNRSQLPYRSRRGIRGYLIESFDSAQGWIAAFAIGLFTALVAFIVDISVETVADWKDGYCTEQFWLNRRSCCALDDTCQYWQPWSEGFTKSYLIYVVVSLLFGVIAASLTLTTKTHLPTADSKTSAGKTMYMAAGSGIPEIKTVLSGFDIPRLFEFKVLAVKAVGAVFAVATGMCLGKEGPFVHISGCVGYLVTMCIPKYASSQRKLREMISVACSAGLSVAFGAPIGGVLFSYEEISTYFPRQVLWRSCLCSMVAAAVLKELNPTGTGKLVLFETNYGVNYDVVHYIVFVFLGVCGGLFGGIFCRSNFKWSNTFRQLAYIKNSPVLEVFIVVFITAVLQYPNPLIRETGDIVMQRLLVDCNDIEEDWICQQEAKSSGKGAYYGWLISGTFAKLVLTTITFGCKVPSGIIIPAMDAGALFGRLIGQVIPDISPGIFAMVGSAAFLAGVSRMTVSLAVIMFELTGEVNFIPPFMIAILTAKWVADYICREGVYDLAQNIQGHPFLDPDHALSKVKEVRHSEGSATVDLLIPRASTMEEVTLPTGPSYRVSTTTLRAKLERLKSRGLMDAGLVIVNDQGICHGYIPQSALENALERIGFGGEMAEVNLFDESLFGGIDRNPLTVLSKAPLEFAVEIFGKLGVGYLVVVEEETANVMGVVVKKQLLSFLSDLG